VYVTCRYLSRHGVYCVDAYDEVYYVDAHNEVYCVDVHADTHQRRRWAPYHVLTYAEGRMIGVTFDAITVDAITVDVITVYARHSLVHQTICQHNLHTHHRDMKISTVHGNQLPPSRP